MTNREARAEIELMGRSAGEAFGDALARAVASMRDPEDEATLGAMLAVTLDGLESAAREMAGLGASRSTVELWCEAARAGLVVAMQRGRATCLACGLPN